MRNISPSSNNKHESIAIHLQIQKWKCYKFNPYFSHCFQIIYGPIRWSLFSKPTVNRNVVLHISCVNCWGRYSHSVPSSRCRESWSIEGFRCDWLPYDCHTFQSDIHQFLLHQLAKPLNAIVWTLLNWHECFIDDGNKNLGSQQWDPWQISIISHCSQFLFRWQSVDSRVQYITDAIADHNPGICPRWKYCLHNQL